MARVAAGGRVILHGADGPVALRVLRAVEDLGGGWCVPVLADQALLEAAGVPDSPCAADIETDAGVVRLTARLDRGEPATAGLMLRDPGLSPAALTEQRRDDVRAQVVLALRGTLLSGSMTPPDPADGTGTEADRNGGAALRGSTVTVSAGGLSATLGGPLPAVDARVYLELEIPDGDLAPAVISVIASGPRQLRGRFVDISPRDRERLVRLVFARQRIELAQRRRSRPR